MNKNIVMIGDIDCASVMGHWNKLLQNTDFNFKYFTRINTDLKYTSNASNLKFLKNHLDNADVIFHHRAIAGGERTDKPIDDSFEFGIKWKEYSDKTIVFLNGSVNLRHFQDHYLKQFSKAKKVVATTADLCEMFNADFMPVPIIIDMPYIERLSKKILINQAPTNVTIKHTAEFKEVCGLLHSKYKNFEYEVICAPYPECLTKKMQAHIGFDHLGGYTGVSAYESCWVGQTTLASLNQQFMRHLFKFTKTPTLPFINTESKQDLKENLDYLLSDVSRIKFHGLYAQKWMNKYWNKEIHINNLNRIIKNV